MRPANPSGLQAAYDRLQLDHGAALAGEANQGHVKPERAILA
jgi:hypothetical protein